MSVATDSALLPVYPPAPVTFVDGDGLWLTDADGRRYLDFAAGIAVVGLGHRHPAPLAAAHAQLDRLWHVSNLFATEPAAALAAKLSARFAGAADASSQGAHAFFCNSGAEANEAALKYARKATGKPGVIALEQSFHGRTTGALAATGQPGKRAGFEPLLPGVRFALPNDVASLRAAASDPAQPQAARSTGRATVASPSSLPAEIGLILLEPVLGEGGVIPLTPEFLAAAAELAAELGALLAFDEVQTGVGRTGSFFAWEQFGVKPHLVTLAKGLANGLPIGCLLVADDAPRGFAVGDHASTFGGNPVTCAAAGAVLDTIDEALLASVRENGARLLAGLAQLPGVVEARGAGLLLGAELSGPAGPVVAAALDAGLVVLTSGANVLRLAPPLTVGAAEVDQALAILQEVMA